MRVDREIPKLPRGRPSKETKKLARKAKRPREKIGELFEGRVSGRIAQDCLRETRMPARAAASRTLHLSF